MTGYLELTIFTFCALGAVWARGRLDTVATAAAVLIAWRGVDSFGWLGLSWSWPQAGAYALLTVVSGALVGYAFSDQLRFRGRKPAQDYIALGLWGVVQQGVLLAWLAQINPWLAVLVFATVHWPNSLLAAVTFLGGGASVAIAYYFGEPCILAAGLSHALLSWWLRDWIGADMGVGEGCEPGRTVGARLRTWAGKPFEFHNGGHRYQVMVPSDGESHTVAINSEHGRLSYSVDGEVQFSVEDA